MKCKDCTIWACVRRRDGEQQCYYEEKKTAYEDVFWYRFRAEAAKDILCAIIASPSIIKLKDDKENLIEFCKEDACKVSILYANELCKQLKEKEEK